jgi:ligand-binding sensor domain-containing protein/tRNA A-37 threonylcarbamoyl transferase component Bud32
MIKKVVAVFIMLLLAMFFRGAVFALDPGRDVTQYIIDAWNSESGLPTNSILALLQTGDGYLWLGTEEGLLRFDGVTFTTFDENNTPEITNNFINWLCEDSNKTLWIGIRGGGLVRWKNNAFRHYTREDGLLHDVINCVTEGPGGALWIGTQGGGVFKFQDNKFSQFPKLNGLPCETVRTIYKDSKENLWFGTNTGLIRMRDNQFANYDMKKNAEENFIRALYEGSDGTLWIGTQKGLFRMRGETIIPTTFNIDFSNMRINALYGDSEKNIWIGSNTNGLFRYRQADGTFSNLSKTAGLADDTIRTIAGDREGNLWIGGAFGGLNRLRDGKFKAFGSREGLADDVVFAVIEDSNGYMWIGANNGLTRTRLKGDGRESLYFSVKDGLSNAAVDSIYEDRQGFIWVGTDYGLNQLKNSPAKIEKVKQYNLEGYVMTILEDSPGNLWAGTTRGLFKKEKNSASWQKVSYEIKGKGEHFKHVNSIYEDNKKNLWFSTYSCGLTKYSGGAYTVYNNKHGLGCVSLNCIYEDADGVLWIGTINGLDRFKDEKFTHFTIKDGLFNNNIYKILEDKKGNFWISCNKGIFTVNKKDLNNYAEKTITAIPCTVYGKDDGMRSSECNGGFQTAGCKTRDGKLWFPTMKGVAIIDPENLIINTLPPPVVVEQVALDGIPASQGEKLTVQPGVKRIEFRYTALSFRVPKRVKFMYRLEGYAKEWVDAGTLRLATYTNLDAGDYRFQVTACNDDGVWNDKGAVVSFSVIPPYWKTWWFRILALMVFAVVSYVMINFIRKYLSLANFWKINKYIGKYKLLDKLGSGGMGTVYKAENTMEKGEKVALKVLREELIEDEKNRKRFRQEAAIVDQLDHPNIIKVYERGQSHRAMYIAMELLEGKTLTKKIEAEGPMDLFESLHIMSQVTDALAKIHSKAIVHRDMKPDNVMLIEKDNDPNFVKLLDFGLAKMLNQTRLTQTGMVIGTINYMAPEQIAGTEISGATDIYSIGVMFYEMLIGKKPFDGETSIDIMKEIIEKIPIEPIRFRTEIPQELNDLVLSMMSKKTAERPTAEEVLSSIQYIYTTLND